jgi:hypothetical protein
MKLRSPHDVIKVGRLRFRDDEEDLATGGLPTLRAPLGRSFPGAALIPIDRNPQRLDSSENREGTDAAG